MDGNAEQGARDRARGRDAAGLNQPARPSVIIAKGNEGAGFAIYQFIYMENALS